MVAISRIAACSDFFMKPRRRDKGAENFASVTFDSVRLPWIGSGEVGGDGGDNPNEDGVGDDDEARHGDLSF